MTNAYTRTDETMAAYVAAGSRLLNRFCNKTGTDMASADPVAFADWLLDQRQYWRPNTWRTRRQQAREIISRMPDDRVSVALDKLAEVPVGPTGTARRTSALKAKRIPLHDFQKLLAFFKYFSRSDIADIARDWLIAGVATGLRPSEWQDTDLLTGERTILVVRNGKATNGRANGEVRHLNLTAFTGVTLEAVGRMVANGAEWSTDGRFEEMQTKVSQVLYAACERLFKSDPRQYCLYSLRHQFTANMKSLKAPTEVSALLGHIASATAQENYGKRRDAWGVDEIVDVPFASGNEIATVRDNARPFPGVPNLAA